MTSLELPPEDRKTPKSKPDGDVKLINLINPLDPSGILKRPFQEDDEALTEIEQIVGAQPTLLGS